MENKKVIKIYLEEKHIEQINDLIKKISFAETPMFNSISHFCRCATIRFINNGGEF